ADAVHVHRHAVASAIPGAARAPMDADRAAGRPDAEGRLARNLALSRAALRSGHDGAAVVAQRVHAGDGADVSFEGDRAVELPVRCRGGLAPELAAQRGLDGLELSDCAAVKPAQ